MKNIEPIFIIIDALSNIPEMTGSFNQFKELKIFIPDQVKDFKDNIKKIYDLNPNTPVIILIHAQQHNEGGFSKGPDVQKEIQKYFPNILSHLITRKSEWNIPGSYAVHQIADAIERKEILSQPVHKLMANKIYKKNNFRLDDDNDWKNRGLHFIVDDDELKEIIGETLHSDAEDIEVKTMTPGLSGAFVLKVKFQHEYQTKFRLLKIDKSISLIENERKASSLLREEDVNTDIFLLAIENGSKIIKDWSCLLFNFKENSATLREYLIKKFYTDSIENLTMVIKNVIDSFYKNFRCHGRHSKEINIWRGSNNYSGLLFFADYRATIIKNILNLYNFIQETKLKNELKDEQIIDILNFIESSKYKQSYLDSKSVKSLLSRVHGDFNSGNVLVNTPDGLNPSFIDFSNMPLVPNSNALLDIAKLSVDFEKYIIKDSSLFNNEIKIRDWAIMHQKCLSNDFRNGGNTELDKLYKLINILFDFSLQIYRDSNLDIEIAKENFFFVRLHYLLRCLSNPYLTIHKKVFALIASIQILEFLHSKTIK